jgi:hypothetical protein
MSNSDKEDFKSFADYLNKAQDKAQAENEKKNQAYASPTSIAVKQNRTKDHHFLFKPERKKEPVKEKPQEKTPVKWGVQKRIENFISSLLRRVSRDKPEVQNVTSTNRKLYQNSHKVVWDTDAGVKVKEKERDISMMGNDFLKAAEQGNSAKIQAMLADGFSVNYQDPDTGDTALIRAAECQARGVLRVLFETEGLDYLKRDNQGRLASEVAFVYGEDPAAARLLGIKERKQGDAKGIKVTRRPLLG